MVLRGNLAGFWGWVGSLNVNGLGGVLTCGVTGFGAGLSHAPVCAVSRFVIKMVLRGNLAGFGGWVGSLNVNGLGGVLTCEVTGFGAGLGHAPVCAVSRDWVSDTWQLSGHQQAAGAFCAGVTEFGSHMLFFGGLLGGGDSHRLATGLPGGPDSHRLATHSAIRRPRLPGARGKACCVLKLVGHLAGATHPV